MIYLVITALAIYFTYIISWIWGWKKNNVNTPKISENKISLIIPCRNEAKNIDKLFSNLLNQKFNFQNLEIILIDDHSNDETLVKLKENRSYESKNTNYEKDIGSIKFMIIELGENEFGKKTAITKGVEEANGDIIVCTDADCEFGKNWLNEISNAFCTDEVKIVSAPVMFTNHKGFWNNIVQLEFLSLIAIGGASIRNKKPTMCNGANIAYRRHVFYEVKGFEGNENKISGDDEFLMQKVFLKYRNGVEFLKNKEAIVLTNPPENLREFVNQRLRWASKAGHYTGLASKFLPFFIFYFNALLLFCIVNLFLSENYNFYLYLLIAKAAIDFVFFWIILKFFNCRRLLFFFIPAQVFHVFYIVIIGLLSVFVKFEWKGRISNQNKIKQALQ